MNNELDDFFRQGLDGHASEPAADLWARLQARTGGEPPRAAADPVDAQFRAGLAGHATPPRRALWERLEDEHLRPRQRRRPVVAWGRLAVAASLLLLMLAGGAGLWLNGRGAAHGPVAVAARAARRQASSPRATAAGQAAPATWAPAGATPAGSAASEKALAAAPATATASSSTAPFSSGAAAGQAVSGARRRAAALLATETTGRQKNQKFFKARATGLGTSSSSSPVASSTAPRRAATAPQLVPGLPRTTPRPDATAGTQLALGGRNTASSQPTTQPEAPALAAAAPQLIEVEVRRGGRPAPALAAATQAPAEAAEAADEARPRHRLGGLLRQAGHALRGEPVSLTEATGLPETVTVQAHLGDRVLSRTIRL